MTGSHTTPVSTALNQIRDKQTEIMRLAPFRDVGLVPNPAAQEAAIDAAEARLGAPLPPSYREFLRLHNGWPRFFEGATLLGAKDVGRRDYVELMQAASEAAETPVPESGPPSRVRGSADSMIPFGIDPDATTLFAFDPGATSADGEMPVIAWINELGVRSSSFLEFLGMVDSLCDSELEARRYERAPRLAAVG